MSADELNVSEAERQVLLGQLNAAESALRSNLHVHRVDTTARAHMERALAHVREACIAISATGHVRNVEQLVTDLLKVERLASQVRQQPNRV